VRSRTTRTDFSLWNFSWQIQLGKAKPDRLKNLCGNALSKRPAAKAAFIFDYFTARLKRLRKNYKTVIPRADLPEESAFFLVLVKKQIPRCARDDKIADFFRGLRSRTLQIIGTCQ
jgi:hypothetical protein